MRIAGGAFKNIPLNTPIGRETRPTSERARAGIFDILRHAHWGGGDILSESVILDGFAGTGALGIEALSRGGKFAYFFEKSAKAAKALSANIARCRLQPQAHLFSTDILRPPIFKKSWEMPLPSLVFLDPPYGRNFVPKTLHALKKAGWLAHPDLVIVAETGENETLDALPFPCLFLEQRRFGAAMTHFFRPEPFVPQAPFPEDAPEPPSLP